MKSTFTGAVKRTKRQRVEKAHENFSTVVSFVFYLLVKHVELLLKEEKYVKEKK